MAKTDIALKRCITGEFVANFVQVFEAKAYEKNAPEFSITMTFEKDAPCLKEMRKCALEAMKEKFGENQDKWPKKWRRPFGDGDEKPEYEGFAGKIYVRAASKSMPGLVDRNRKPIIDKADFYSGCIARAELIAFAYDTNGNRGVSFSLQNIQKIRNGEALSGRKAAEDVFDVIPGDDDEDADLMGTGGDEDESDGFDEPKKKTTKGKPAANDFDDEKMW